MTFSPATKRLDEDNINREIDLSRLRFYCGVAVVIVVGAHWSLFYGSPKL